jgi:hypothetical protein
MRNPKSVVNAPLPSIKKVTPDKRELTDFKVYSKTVILEP